MPWKTSSRRYSELTVLALPSDVKAMLINRKALTRQSVTSQIVEASKTGGAGPVPEWGPVTGNRRRGCPRRSAATGARRSCKIRRRPP